MSDSATQLLDFEVVLPDHLRLETRSTTGVGVCIELVGDGAQTAVASVVKKAEEVGFVLANPGPGRVELARGEQRLVLLSDSSGLTIQTYDPTLLPVARHDGAAVLLADLRVNLGAAAIAPLRERRTGELRRAAWKLSGVSAPDVVRCVIDEGVRRMGLARGATFRPAKGGTEVWTAEASSKTALVKARATVESDHVLLEIDLVDKRGNEQA
jgi:hypothetical protein